MSSSESAPYPPTSRRRQSWPWIIAATTFLLGLLLGAGLMTVVGYGPDSDVTHATTAESAPSTDNRGVVLPASCQEALDQAKASVTAAQDAIDAVRRLQTGRLQRLLDELENARRQLDRTTARCHDAAGIK